MRRALWHLVLPAAVAIWAVLLAVRFEPLTVQLVASVGFLGFLYYSAPHLLWLLIAGAARLSAGLAHAGLIAANISLTVISSFPLLGLRDPSGLPLQWMAYWPLALVLMVAVALMALFRARSPRVEV